MELVKQIIRYRLYISGLIYLLDKDAKFCIHDLKGGCLYVDSKDDFIEFTDNCNYVRSGYDSTGYIVVDNVLGQKSIRFHEVSNNDIAICRNNDSDQETLFKLPEEKQILKEWLPNNIYHIQGQYWCNDTEEDFKLIDAETGEIVWSIAQPVVERPYGYSGLTNIRKVLGIYNDCLWLQLPDSRVWGLDIHTGELKEEIKHENFLVHEDTILLDQSFGKIVVFCFDLYACFDLNTLQFSVEYILPDTIRIGKSALFKSDKLVFVGLRSSRDPNVYGIFDTTNCNFVFQGEQLEADGFFYDIPQVNDDLFTILDSKGNLIIHEMKDILPEFNAV